MATQERRTAPRRANQQEASAPSTNAGTQERGEKLRAALDELIDEIDESLAEDAEEFVANYVQKGGQ